MRRKDTPENREFWESVEGASDELRMTEPEWSLRLREEKRRDLFLVLVYLATNRGTKAIDMPRTDVARAFLTALIGFVDHAWILQVGLGHFLKSPFIDHVGTNKRLSHTLTGTELQRNHPELCNNLYHLLKFKRREYVGPPESEVWYESDFEEYLKDLNKTRSLDFTMSVRDARTAEEVLNRLSDEEKKILEVIAGVAANHLELV